MAAYAAAGLFRRGGPKAQEAAAVVPRNPFELGTALRFGLALVMVPSLALQAWLGEAGLYFLAAAGLGLPVPPPGMPAAP